MEVQILDRIADRTAQRVIKKALNDKQMLDMVKVRVETALDEACRELAVEKVRVNWMTSYRISDTANKQVTDLLKNEVNLIAKELFVEALKDEGMVRGVIERMVLKELVSAVNTQIGRMDAEAEKAVERAIRKKFGMDGEKQGGRG